MRNLIYFLNVAYMKILSDKGKNAFRLFQKIYMYQLDQ